MNPARPSCRLLQTSSPSRSSCILHIRQWHPRPLQRRYTSTTPAPLPKTSRRYVRPAIWGLLFSIMGYGLGYGMILTIAPPPERDSEADIMMQKVIIMGADDIPAIGTMLKHIGEVDYEWDEVSIPPQEGDTMVNDTLRGSAGLVIPRAFWNEKEQELLMVVYYGSSLCGWPGIAHGGCTATVLLEAMGRALNCLTGGQQYVRPPNPSELGLTYLKPIRAGKYHLLKAKIQTGDAALPQPETNISAEKDLTKKLHEERSGIVGRLRKKYDVDCTLESLEGIQCMKAKGVWDML